VAGYKDVELSPELDPTHTSEVSTVRINNALRTVILLAGVSVALLLPSGSSGQSATSELTAKVDKLFAAVDKPTSPGCSLAVIKDGQIVYKRGYGIADLDHDIPIRPDTSFHAASLSKQFTAFSILLLAQQGKLSLDDKVQKYVPELREFEQPITIRHLLHHTSGLRDQWSLLIMSGWRLGEDVVRDDDILDLVSRMKGLNFPPGDQYAYSNTGFTLLAFIVKRVSGQSLREFTEANIFKPLAMSRTFFRDDHAVVSKNQAYGYNSGPNGTFKLSVPNYDTVGASSLLTTVEDLARWDQNFYDKRIGGDWVIEQMQIRGQLNDGQTIPYARGLVMGTYKGLKTVDHGGSDAGYRSHILRFPDQRFGVACLCNYGGLNPGALAYQVADIYLAGQLTPAPERPMPAGIELTQDELKSRTGAFWDTRSEELVRTSIAEGKLRLNGLGFNGVLTPVEKNRFRGPDRNLEVVFESSAQGATSGIVVNMDGSRPTKFEAMLPADTSRMGDYEGLYYSDEIDLVYRVSQREGRLVVTRRKFNPIQLTAAFRDGFASQSVLGTVRFTRDSQNRVNGFRVSAGRVRNFAFVKQD
jgi:CubicO group peptidase (beta-lactamase class C family)